MTVKTQKSLKSLNELLRFPLMIQKRNGVRVGANERREEREPDENASLYAERHRLRSGVAVLFFSRVPVVLSALSRAPARSHFRHLNFSLRKTWFK